MPLRRTIAGEAVAEPCGMRLEPWMTRTEASRWPHIGFDRVNSGSPIPAAVETAFYLPTRGETILAGAANGAALPR
jgi:hypothetical protein